MEVQLHARRLLSHASPTIPSPGPARSVAEGGSPASSFSSLDATVVTVLSLLLCSLVVALMLNAVVRCAFRVTRHVCYGQEPPELAGQGGPETTCRRPSPVRALPALAYSAELELAGSASECAICLAEFARGAHVRVLPRCNHGFHVRCIDRWLAARQTCPTCRQEPFAKPALPGTAVVPAEQLEAHDGTSQRMAL